MNDLIVIVSVDWEPDHGRWIYSGSEIDCGGVLKGTPAFCRLLDDLEIPCTWFVETSYDPKRNLPSRYPELVQLIGNRKKDEIGLHIHWRKPTADNSIYYETEDVDWVSAQLEHGVRQLEAQGARPTAFRSGARLHVTDLPRILKTLGFQVDSSTLWGRANRLTSNRRKIAQRSTWARVGSLLRRALDAPSEPYFTSERSVEQHGSSGIVELPITYSLFALKRWPQEFLSRYFRYRASMMGGVGYLMLFFHIDELTAAESGPDDKARLDSDMIQHFRRHLIDLKKQGARFLTCSAARSYWLKEAKGEQAHPSSKEGMAR